MNSSISIFTKESNQNMGIFAICRAFVKFHFRIHCFNDKQTSKQCHDLEISYLIQCKPLQNAVQIQPRIPICDVPIHVTYPMPITNSTSDSGSLTAKLISIYLVLTLL